jgi:hypothetical protein
MSTTAARGEGGVRAVVAVGFPVFRYPLKIMKQYHGAHPFLGVTPHSRWLKNPTMQKAEKMAIFHEPCRKSTMTSEDCTR